MDFANKRILVTGSAGFIGSNLVQRLLRECMGSTVVGVDNVNDYYDVSIKEWRLAEIERIAKENAGNKYVFVRGDIADKALVDSLFNEYKPEIVVNLAAQAGVPNRCWQTVSPLPLPWNPYKAFLYFPSMRPPEAMRQTVAQPWPILRYPVRIPL